MNTRIYVASSWRNKFQPDWVKALRENGFEVYDFREPEPGDNGFHWSDIDIDWKNWTPQKYLNGLEHPIACVGFENDINALKDCDFCVLILPCGRSAHLEAGYAIGAGKKVAIMLSEDIEPELMYKMANVFYDETALVNWLIAEAELVEAGSLEPEKGVEK